MNPTLTLTADVVRNALDYDPSTGALTWRRWRPGILAGTVHKSGYRVISIGNTLFSAHRLAWAHHTGAWPLQLIDHINRDRLDNRFSNLREADHSQNGANCSARGASGIKGAYLRSSGHWQAIIRIRGKCIPLGTFASKEEASAAYYAAASAVHGEFASAS